MVARQRGLCPTERCHSIPMDWVLPNDQVLARLAVSEGKESFSRAKIIVHAREKFSERLRRFALQFRPAH